MKKIIIIGSGVGGATVANELVTHNNDINRKRIRKTKIIVIIVMIMIRRIKIKK